MTASLAHRIAPYVAGVLAIAGACLVPRIASASAPAVAGLVNAGPARPGVNGISPAPAWSFESNITNAFLGMSAAVAGDVNGDGFDDAVAYASSGGRLWLFFGGPSGPTLAPGFPATIPIDGSHVAAAGDVNGDGYADVVAGWPGATFGTIRVYNGGPSGLNVASPFVLFQNFSNNFGQYVGTAGDVNGDGYDEVIVGSPGFPGNVSLCGTTSSTGKVDVFYGSATGLNADPAVNWVLMGCRHVANGGAMGTAAATAGDVNGDGYDDIVVGAPGATVGIGGTPHGSAWVIYGSASKLPLTPGFSNLGTLAGSTRLDSPTAFASFGSGAITAGDVNADGYADVAVGAPTDDTFASDAGFVRVYPGGPGGVSTTEMWWESSSFANTRMGHRLVPAGDVNGDRRGDLLVGTSGGALLGTSIGNGLLFVQGLVVPHAFGTAGDVNGDGFSDVLVTDAYWANGQALEGRITFHSGVGETGRALVWSFIQGVEVNPNMGWSVSSAGDVNGDGYDDVLVGSPTADNVGAGQTDNGTVELYLGAPGALSPSAAFSAFGGPSDQLGIAVAPVGDVNGDGYCDVAAGAHQGGVGNGKVLVWYGGPSAPFPGAVPNVVLNGPSAGSQFGAALTGGDFNGDGYADVAVGAPYDDITVHGFPYTDAGRVFVYYGGPAGLSSSPANVFFMAEDNAHFGAAVAGGADTDGDSYTELIIGAPDHDAPAPPFTLPDAGSVFEYGRSGSTALTFRRTVGHGSSFDRFGASLAHAGDVDGDGYGDIIVGATGAVNTLQGEGGAWVFHGGAAGLDPSPLWAQAGGEVNGAFGSSVSGAGDVNGDGLSDVLVGAVFQDAGGAQDRGTARVYLGPLTAGTPAAWTGFGPGTFANMGHCVANAGDVDGDGWPDLVFGEPGFTSTAFREGKIELYAGAWGLAPPAVTHAVRASGPIAPLGLTDVGAMMFQHEARSAAGRTGVKLAWRLTSTLIGVPAPTIAGMQGSYTPTGPILGSGSQASLSQGVSGLKSGFPYAWQVRTRSRSVYFPTTKWTSFARNGALEWDVRVPGSLDAPVATTAAPELMLSAPSPNPSRGLSWVRFALPRATRVSLVVYDAQGRRVRQVLDGPMAAGPHEARWDGARDDGSRAGTGVYFYRFEADGARSSRRVVLVH